MKLAIVTATVDLPRAMSCMASWGQCAAHADALTLYIVAQGERDAATPVWEELPMRGATPETIMGIMLPEILGVVPAFALGVQQALEDGADVIACLHDDLEIEGQGWDTQVLRAFQNPRVGLLGFGGATGLGSTDIYVAPYNPMQLVRHDFVSNMRHAEAHGRRSMLPERVACLDGFSQIGRREYWLHDRLVGEYISPLADRPGLNLFQQLAEWGMVHHAYDAALGAFAARLGWEVWTLPVAVHHYGGRTAVADDRYTSWAKERFHARDWTGTKDVEGDAACWTLAHRIAYEQFRDVLPVRVGRG